MPFNNIIRKMFPEDFIQRLASQEYVDHESLLQALEDPSPVSIRLNPAKWRLQPLNSEQVPWCRNGYYLPSRPTYTLDPLLHAGCYYPQEASGMFLEQLFLQLAGNEENLKVLDLCGSPGGKSTHIADLIGPSGLVIANEVIRSRAAVLAETVTKWGTGNILVSQNDPSVLGRLSGYFDVILVDAPCSGEGMFRNQAAKSEWSVENTEHCSVRQKRIVMDVWPALKENGILLYSTCTFNPAENEENIKWLLDQHDAECLRIDIGAFRGIKEIDYRGIYGYGFYPDKVKGEGFFISAVRKISGENRKHLKSAGKSDYKPEKKEISFAMEWADFNGDRILKRGDELYAIPSSPEDYFYLFQNLKVVKSGTRIALRKKNDYIPSFELALCVQRRKNAFPETELDQEQAIAFLRRDTLNFQMNLRGWNIVTYNGLSLGFVNNLGNRLNNYFPVEWRIRLDVSGERKILPVVWSDEANL